MLILIIGLVGKPNAGKSTFFSAATNIDTKIANYAFTTIDAKEGVAYVTQRCAHIDLNLPKCDANNSICINGIRHIPVEIIDVAGLVPDAHKGKGLGLQFLNDLIKADCLIHIVDVSGTTDLNGNQRQAQSVIDEVLFLTQELDQWIALIIKRNWSKVRGRSIDELSSILSGLKITHAQINEICDELGLEKKRLDWSDEQILDFSNKIRRLSKPIIIAANKMDLDTSKEFFNELKYHFKDQNIAIFPCFANYELALSKAFNSKLISSLDLDFKIDEKKANQKQIKALENIRKQMKQFKQSRISDILNYAVFNLLNQIVVYPVVDENKFTDNKGRVLPDAFLLSNQSTPVDLAYAIHTDIGKNFITAIDCRKKTRLSKDHKLKMNDVIKIVSKS